ncbi:hypothetical protein NIES2119_31770 [[Phormidium ambiguum] IAM M-71]|uniref:Integrase n=1 Tax=[Phormidium ambiguum] IAM M-71 TaxID=454136 RepID=A0A1U7I1R9_9CYAN|nr:tyrosine-type recombinase/integrase [Phormidium ambiguum]OKH29951.1 hypothetical protein NIES2119_31770 [Phormidium ambiguum IAM M-71]
MTLTPTGFAPILPLERDIMQCLIEDKRSSNTKRAYATDLGYFFQFAYGSKPTPEMVKAFLSLSRRQAVSLVLQWKASMMSASLAEATVNRRLAAIKSLVRFAHEKFDACEWTLDAVKGERVESYRDTTGIGPNDYRRVISLCDRTTVQGKRDYAILRLLWDNALRRGEICQLDVRDFDAARNQLWILGKGRGDQKELIDLASPTAVAVLDWVEHSQLDADAPLFVSLAFASVGHRLTGEAIRLIVVGYCQRAGVSKVMSPHRVRHSSITASLDAGLDVRKVQKLSRHKSIETLLKYDDNRQRIQGEISDLLAGLI